MPGCLAEGLPRRVSFGVAAGPGMVSVPLNRWGPGRVRVSHRGKMGQGETPRYTGQLCGVTMGGRQGHGVKAGPRIREGPRE